MFLATEWNVNMLQVGVGKATFIMECYFELIIAQGLVTTVQIFRSKGMKV